MDISSSYYFFILSIKSLDQFDLLENDVLSTFEIMKSIYLVRQWTKISRSIAVQF